MTQRNDLAIEIDRCWKRFRKGGADGLLWEAVVRGARGLLGGDFGARDVFWALKDVNFNVRRGEAVGIIGPNGAGKSTLLKILSRVLRADRGSVAIHGRLSGLIEVGAGFHGDLSGRENIFVNGAILGMSRREIREKFDRIVDFAGIGEFLDMPVKRYSSGMYVRLGFSIAAPVGPIGVLCIRRSLADGARSGFVSGLGAAPAGAIYRPLPPPLSPPRWPRWARQGYPQYCSHRPSAG